MKCLIVAIVALISGSMTWAQEARRYAPDVPRFEENLDESGQFEVLNSPRGFSGLMDLRYSRDFRTFYGRRAYVGAPPVIPHVVEGVRFEKSASCLVCHDQGGFVTKFNAYAPPSPHVERVSCRQCHVPVVDPQDFKPHQWQSPRPPEIGRAAIPGGPPPIPHGLHDRGQCLTCHAGPAAIREVRTSHPERIHCRQCHMTIVNQDRGE